MRKNARYNVAMNSAGNIEVSKKGRVLMVHKIDEFVLTSKHTYGNKLIDTYPDYVHKRAWQLYDERKNKEIKDLMSIQESLEKHSEPNSTDT